MKKIYLTFLIAICSAGIFAQSTSPNAPGNQGVNPMQGIQQTVQGLNANASQTITFSEYSVGTPITDQFKSIGIIFGGSGPFISTDGANPTSPVLSGTPRFQGSITGTFVEPGTTNPTVVQAFMFDAGYFDEYGSTRIEWFDPEGKKLGQRINSILGIETFYIEGGNIASWKISIVADEPFGFAIDNVSFVPIGPSVVFREKIEKDGTWWLLGDEIPGFDHVGFQMANVVYESHPGYSSGTYISADGQESQFVAQVYGVQGQHTLKTFAYYSKTPGSTIVTDFQEVPIDENLATNMRTHIQSVMGSGFQGIDYFSLDGIEETLSPAAQKGGGGTFTCVGLVEWAAEQAGHRGGQGFIDSKYESFTIPHPKNPLGDVFEVPLLSPELLYHAIRGQNLLFNAKQFVQGLLDPVDFIITDPLGRRLGYVEGLGEINEIPHAFYSGNGDVEQFLIPTAIPGPYTIKYIGTGDSVFAAIASFETTDSFFDSLLVGDTVEKAIFVQPKNGSMGDVDNDGDVDQDDIDNLLTQLNRFTNGMDHPGDLDGNGLLDNNDVVLLTQLVGVLDGCNTPGSCGDFTLVDAVSDQDIGPLNDGDVIDLATLATNQLNVRANLEGPGVESIRFSFQNVAKYRVENFAPYALEGDDNGDYNALVFTPGTYTISATPYDGRNGKGTKGEKKTIVVTFIDSNQGAKKLSEASMIVYPNPASTKFTIDLQNVEPGEVEFAVYNLTGQLIKRETANTQSPSMTYKMDLMNVPAGMYLVKVTNGGNQLSKRIVKVK
ncbi:MAG: T9SS type A sorting domain-containing protein [Bacteroidetes bacterium]|nr:T9SS type A sorting domain-containing protein [Bacteroidota bacterium]MCB0845738.1 T9SS type A sorting domain-containing protein [Bacteroidota bacterium]